VWLLNEQMGVVSWLAILGLTTGLLLMTVPKRQKIQT
jgi:hypothetical protein